MKFTKLLAFALIAAGLCTLSAAEKDKKFKIAANIEDNTKGFVEINVISTNPCFALFKFLIEPLYELFSSIFP